MTQKDILKLKSINIFSKNYTVTYHKEKYEVSDDRQTRLLGCVKLDEKEIRIYQNEKSKREAVISILLHEIIHAVISELNLDEFIKDDYNELVVDNIATGLGDVLIRNNIIK